MCGRYCVDEELLEELERTIGEVERKIREQFRGGDICPTQEAPVVTAGAHGLKLSYCHWGFPSFNGKSVLINARAETAMTRPAFQNGIRRSRIAIPARAFYEWNKRKEKFTFSGGDDSILYLAGFQDLFPEGDRFIILTTAANPSVEKVHDRMPLILEPAQVEAWIKEPEMTEAILRQTPRLLKQRTEYEQQTVFL